ncbi:hypothetical protein BSKO_00523 [Bryopsis sp. KO-2023]|nr:hypothetical protein BSKO_00523 [Bryopsis sp. KO-2023]
MLVFVLILCVAVRGSWAGTAIEVPVEHSFGNGDFTHAGFLRGKISSKGSMLGNLVFVREPFSQQEKSSMKKIVDSNGFYRLRIASVPVDASSTKVMASLRAQCMASRRFKESILLELTDDNRIVGLDYRTASGNCNPREKVEGFDGEVAFADEVEVMFKYPFSAPSISMDDILSNVNVDDGSKDGQKPGQGKGQKVEKSWFQQNWMFIFAGAVIVIQVMGNLAEEDGGGGGAGAVAGGRGGGGGGRGGGRAVRGRR